MAAIVSSLWTQRDAYSRPMHWRATSSSTDQRFVPRSDLPQSVQHSVRAAGHALPGGVGYPLGSIEGLPRVPPLFPDFAWRTRQRDASPRFRVRHLDPGQDASRNGESALRAPAQTPAISSEKSDPASTGRRGPRQPAGPASSRLERMAPHSVGYTNQVLRSGSQDSTRSQPRTPGRSKRWVRTPSGT
jgi:hypothetical protein